MGWEEEGWVGRAPAPGGAPVYVHGEDNWTHFDKSVNAVYFGFVATAILVFMFLVMAIFEKFLRPNSPSISSPAARIRSSDVGALGSNGGGFNAKLDYPASPKVAMDAKEVSVLMPGNNVPTFIANPAPMPSLSTSSDRVLLSVTTTDIQPNNTNICDNDE